MHAHFQAARDFLKREDGATMAEYVVLMAVIVLAVIGGISLFRESLDDTFETMQQEVEEAATPQ